MTGLLRVKSDSKPWSLSACGCEPNGPRIIKSVTFTTRTRRAGISFRSKAAAAMTSNVTSTPIPTRTTSGAIPSSVDANFQTDAPAMQCYKEAEKIS